MLPFLWWAIIRENSAENRSFRSDQISITYRVGENGSCAEMDARRDRRLKILKNSSKVKFSPYFTWNMGKMMVIYVQTTARAKVLYLCSITMANSMLIWPRSMGQTLLVWLQQKFYRDPSKKKKNVKKNARARMLFWKNVPENQNINFAWPNVASWWK